MNHHLKNRLSVLLLLLAIFLFASPVSAALLDFELTPLGGQLLAARGKMAGWGYTLTNNSLDQWLVPTTLNSDPFLFGQPLPLFDFPILSPGASVSVDFDPVQMTGLYAVTVAQDAPLAFVEQGRFTLAAEWWSDDPAGSGTPLDSAIDALAPWSVEITGIPEPATIAPVCIALAALFCMRRKLSFLIGGDK